MPVVDLQRLATESCWQVLDDNHKTYVVTPAYMQRPTVTQLDQQQDRSIVTVLLCCQGQRSSSADAGSIPAFGHGEASQMSPNIISSIP